MNVGRDHAEVGGREHALARHAMRRRERLELLEVREACDVHLRSQMARDRGVGGLGGTKAAARQGPGVREGLASSLPGQHAELSVSHLGDDGEHLVREALRFRTALHGKIVYAR